MSRPRRLEPCRRGWEWGPEIWDENICTSAENSLRYVPVNVSSGKEPRRNFPGNDCRPVYPIKKSAVLARYEQLGLYMNYDKITHRQAQEL